MSANSLVTKTGTKTGIRRNHQFISAGRGWGIGILLGVSMHAHDLDFTVTPKSVRFLRHHRNLCGVVCNTVYCNTVYGHNSRVQHPGCLDFRCIHNLVHVSPAVEGGF